MRVLQIGAGRWGRNHLRSWQRLGVELVVCDADPAVRAGLASPTVETPSEALDDVDAVDVVTPAQSHASLARQALEAGRDVLVEKPLTPEGNDAFELDALARERRAVLQVGHVFRFAPEALALAGALRGGSIGRPRFVSGRFAAYKSPRRDGGVAISDAIHWIDLVSWLLDRQPDSVSATLRDCLGRGMDDVALVTLDYGETTAQIEASCVHPEPRRDLLVVGSDGALVCDFRAPRDRLRLFRTRPGAAQGERGPRLGEGEALPVGSEEPLLAELRAFVQGCRMRRLQSPAAGGWAGAAAVSVVEACVRSAAEGRRIEVKLPTPAREPVA